MDFLYQRGEYVDVPCPNVVLLDLDLPKRNGDRVLEEIKADSELRRIPVIVLTSSESEGDIVKSYDLDANAYLVKPVDPEDFIDVVRTLERFRLSIVSLPDCDG